MFKNQIWSELIGLIPIENQKSNYHQNTVDANVCMEFLKKYFARLDAKISVELRKSKQVSLLAEKVTLNSFGTYAEVLQRVSDEMDYYVENADETK